MLLNQEKKARKCIKSLAIKKDVKIKDIAEKLNISSTVLHKNLQNESMKLSTFIKCIQGIDKEYKVNIYFNTPEEYHIQVLFHDVVLESFYIYESKTENRS